MSIAGIGGPGAGNASQMLQALLSRLDQQSGSTMEVDDTSSATPAQSGCSPAINGSNKPSLSSMVLGALIGVQQQASDRSSTTSTSSTTGQDPVQSLFAAMDSDGDGTVSQTEMESYIQNQGGTTKEADTLYGMLTQNGTTGLTEDQLASQAPPPGADGAQGVGGRHHGHHHHHEVSSDDGADALMQALDADANGSVDQNELSNFVTKNGGTANQAAAIFSSLDTQNTGSIGSADFASAIEKLQSNMDSGSYSPTMMMLNAFADNSAINTSTVSVAA